MATKLTRNLDRALTVERVPLEAGRGTWTVFAGNIALSQSATEAEAREAQRAFANVLAPRFTRDEAIAIVVKALHPALPTTGRKVVPAAMLAGARLTLEALAAAGVFVDADEGGNTAHHMADLLDAAGIK